jgi:hypothetical protein
MDSASGILKMTRRRLVAEIAAPPNKELKLTKPGTIGASQLNSSVGRTVAEGA